MIRLIFGLMLVGGTARAQGGFDNVLFTNGVEFTGKVTSVAGDSISFMHKNESLVYRFPKSRIFRIQFASGRTELITSGESTGGTTPEKPAKAARPVANAQRNMIAVLPFRFVHSRGYNPEMPYTIQTEYYKQARALNGSYDYQDPNTTNALLARRGIDAQQLRGYTMDELCAILEVSHVVMGTVTMTSTGHTVTNTGTTTPGTTIFGRPTTVSTNQTMAKENFTTNVEVNIYNDTGRLIYNRAKQSIWSTPDAYKLAISYVLKRTPL